MTEPAPLDEARTRHDWARAVLHLLPVSYFSTRITPPYQLARARDVHDIAAYAAISTDPHVYHGEEIEIVLGQRRDERLEEHLAYLDLTLALHGRAVERPPYVIGDEMERPPYVVGDETACDTLPATPLD